MYLLEDSKLVSISIITLILIVIIWLLLHLQSTKISSDLPSLLIRLISTIPKINFIIILLSIPQSPQFQLAKSPIIIQIIINTSIQTLLIQTTREIKLHKQLQLINTGTTINSLKVKMMKTLLLSIHSLKEYMDL